MTVDPQRPDLQRIWIDRPWIDLLVGCGGWSIPLLLVSYTLLDRDAARWSALFYGLAVVCNYPHYMATIYRAYGRDDRRQYRLFTHHATVLLALAAVAAHVRVDLVPWLFTIYVMWSPWHYTGQNFGLLMMFLRRAGLDVSPSERRWLRIAFVASYVMLLAAFNSGSSHDPLVRSAGLPSAVALALEGGAVAVFVIASGLAFDPLARRASWRALLAPATLWSTQALWFVVPIVATWVARLPVPQTRYSSGMLALMHSAQYLWITRYFARRESERAALSWSVWKYAATLVAGGLALFLPVPWLASYAGHFDFTTSMLIVTAVVNIHHFVLDGVVWKLRDPRVGQLLVSSPKAVAKPERPLRAGAWTGALAARPWRTIGVALLAALAVIDQWRYALALETGNRRRLETATALNPYDSTAYIRLAHAASGTGDTAGAERAFRRAIEISPQNPVPAQGLERLLIDAGRQSEAYAQCLAVLDRWPGDIDALVNAGVLAARLGESAAAERWWKTALQHDPTLARVQLYLAELLDARGDSAAAVPHYRAYLELAAQRGRQGLDPREVVSVVVKFADALARSGESALAATQYELAAHMAAQTGLKDLEALARQGLADLGR